MIHDLCEDPIYLEFPPGAVKQKFKARRQTWQRIEKVVG
jgi:hypothetical protein